MSLEDTRNDEKTLEDGPEDDECRDLLAGMREPGPPKFHAKVAAASTGAAAASYAHEPREPPKGADTIPGDMQPVLLNATPVPDARQVTTHPKAERVTFETAPGIRHTKTTVVALAGAMVMVVAVTAIVLLLRSGSSERVVLPVIATSASALTRATPTFAISPSSSASSAPETAPTPRGFPSTASRPQAPPPRYRATSEGPTRPSGSTTIMDPPSAPSPAPPPTSRFSAFQEDDRK